MPRTNNKPMKEIGAISISPLYLLVLYAIVYTHFDSNARARSAA